MLTRPNMRNRLTRVNDEITRELAGLIRGELKDPRLAAMTSVLGADTTSDFKYCKVYVSVMGNAEAKQAAMSGLKSASGYIRRLLAERLNLRVTPELTFVLDESIDYGMKLDALIREVNRDAPGNP